MDWFLIASNDYKIYGDVARIKNYVIKGKITPEQYQIITGIAYE
jgi:hypothetical protein